MKPLVQYSALLLLLVACQQELSPEDYEFRGNWDSGKYALQIMKNGYGVCNRKNWGTCEGRVKIKGDRITFTSNSDESTLPWVKFKINQRPTVDADGITYMVLDGDRFERH